MSSDTTETSEPRPRRDDPYADKDTTGGMTGTAIRHPVGAIALAMVVIVLGVFFVDRLAVDLLPTINYPQIRATVNYPGTAPEVMEQQVTRVLESNLAATENLDSIESRASEGRTNVNLIFEYGTDIDVALQDAARNLELAKTQLPDDVEPARLYKFDPSQAPVYELGFTSSIRSPIEVRDWLDNELAPHIQATSGVGGVEVSGGQVREMQVVLDQQRLEHYGISITSIEERLADENVDIAAGQVTSETFDVMAKTDGRFETVEDLERVVLPIPESSETLLLGDVADVRDTHQEQRIFVRLDGEPSTRLSVTKLPDANTVEVIEGVKSQVERLDEDGVIPEDIDYQVTTDQSFFINNSIGAVATAAILGGLLAMLVVLMFLGSLRKAFVIGLTIPIAMLATFAMMGLGGLTLNVMTLGGLALGVGLLLDNSIVMLENIDRHRDEYQKADDDAAFDGSREVMSAVIASTMTNLAAVTPFLLITGLAAMVFRELIITITFAIVASLAAALTVVPMLSALLAKIRFRSRFDTTFVVRGFHRVVDAATGAYVAVAERAFRLKWLVVIGAVAALMASLTLLEDLGDEFLPQVDDGNVSVFVGLPPGAPPDVTYDRAMEVEEQLQDMPHVDHYFGLVGGHLGGGILNERPGTARYSIHLTPATERPEMTAGQWVQEMDRRLEDLEIPGARTGASPPSIPGIRTTTDGSAVSLGIVGEDLEALDDVGRDLLRELEDIDGLSDIDLARDDRSPLLDIDVDRERAADFGLSVGEVGQAVRTAVQGSVPTEFSTGQTEYDVRVQLPRDEVRHTEDLSNLILFRDGGESIRLGDIASFSLGDGPAHITRENQVRLLRIGGDINTEVTDIGTVNDEIRDRVADFDMPDEFSLIFGGEQEVIEETNRNLRTVTLLALFVVFVVMAVQYERFANPLIILTAVPLALIGVISGLWLTETNLSAPVLIGVILLVGIVVNNAILLVEYIEIGRKERNLPIVDAALEAGRIRFRPILMTTTTTVCGMLPLAIGLGEGAELMRPLAIAVVGGLLVAMVLTLFVVPSIYLIVSPVAEKLQEWMTGTAIDEDSESRRDGAV